jgi:hypothetical protein
VYQLEFFISLTANFLRFIFVNLEPSKKRIDARCRQVWVKTVTSWERGIYLPCVAENTEPLLLAVTFNSCTMSGCLGKSLFST